MAFRKIIPNNMTLDTTCGVMIFEGQMQHDLDNPILRQMKERLDQGEMSMEQPVSRKERMARVGGRPAALPNRTPEDELGEPAERVREPPGLAQARPPSTKSIGPPCTRTTTSSSYLPLETFETMRS